MNDARLELIRRAAANHKKRKEEDEELRRHEEERRRQEEAASRDEQSLKSNHFSATKPLDKKEKKRQKMNQFAEEHGLKDIRVMLMEAKTKEKKEGFTEWVENKHANSIASEQLIVRMPRKTEIDASEQLIVRMPRKTEIDADMEDKKKNENEEIDADMEDKKKNENDEENAIADDVRRVVIACGLDEKDAAALLQQQHGSVETAIVTFFGGLVDE